jgi:hypothetical protein
MPANHERNDIIRRFGERRLSAESESLATQRWGTDSRDPRLVFLSAESGKAPSKRVNSARLCKTHTSALCSGISPSRQFGLADPEAVAHTRYKVRPSTSRKPLLRPLVRPNIS